MSGPFVLAGRQSDFAARWDDGGLPEFVGGIITATLDDARVAPGEVDACHVGNFVGELFTGQGHLGAMLAAVEPGLSGRPAARHEAACASGSMALLAAMRDLEAGHADVALVVGVEQMRNVPGQEAAEHLGAAMFVGREGAGATFPWPFQFSQIADAYAERYGLDHAHLAAIAEKNFDNAKRNPLAQARAWQFEDEAFGEDDALNPVIEGRIRKQDCGRITDGVSAVVLASARFARSWSARSGRSLDSVPRIAGWGHATASLLLDDKLRRRHHSGLLFPHLRTAVADARLRAGTTLDDIDVVETHDCFTISEYLAYDHLGLTAPGQAWQAVESGMTAFDGPLPVNPSGGLIGCGHPVGATGVRMVADAAHQVAGTAGDHQVGGARIAQTLNIGGSCTTVASFVVQVGGA